VLDDRNGNRGGEAAPAMTDDLDRAAIREEMEQARQEFRRLLDDATEADLRRPSDGTKWNNQQLLFHMLFGYLITHALLVLVRVFGLLPDAASKAFARLLDSARAPFHVINYLGSCAGARIIPPAHMAGVLDRVIAALQRHLRRETAAALRRGMHYPTTWDPYFAEYMTLAGLYRYPTQHFRHHRQQLTISSTGCFRLGRLPRTAGNRARKVGYPGLVTSSRKAMVAAVVARRQASRVASNPSREGRSPRQPGT
jgi:DinB superfamily